MKHNITIIIISWALLTLTPCLATNSTPLSGNNKKHTQIYVVTAIKYQLLNLNPFNQPIKPSIISMSADTTQPNTQHMKGASKHTLKFQAIKLHKTATTDELIFIDYHNEKSLKEKHYGAWRNDRMQANLHINID